MSTRYSFGPGKVILVGEHGVVYGYPAIAGSLSRGVKATARAAKRPMLKLGRSLAAPAKRSLSRAFEVGLEVAGRPSLEVSLESELPLSMGLGSSGAVSVALSRVLLEKPTAAEVESLSLKMETVFHGRPSGLDHTTSAREGLLWFQKGVARGLTPGKPLQVVVALAGKRRPTKELVEALRERQSRWPRRYQRLFEEIGRLVVEARTAIVGGDLDALGDVMNVNQGLLSALQVSGPKLDGMVQRLRALGAMGAKLTGAGGDGGAVVGLFRDPASAVKQLRREGVECFASELGQVVLP